MILLDGHSLAARQLVHPETFALNLSERDSTATITLPPDAPEIALGDWLQDTTEPGAGIVWRVKTRDAQINALQRSCALEHMVRSLSDRILGEVYPQDMSGEDLTPAQAKTAVCTARQALEYILARQDDWVLGELDPAYETVSNPFHFNGDTLLAALETVSGSLEDPLWSYDFTVYPFRLNIAKMTDAVGCEMRAGRNITTLKITEDRSRLYTRIYPIGKNNMRLPDPGYLSQNEQLYGVIEKTETDQSQETEEQLTMWAQERLSRHCEPSVTVTISGLDLSEATGEPLDRLTIGKRCRVPLPSNGSVIAEKVTKLAWRDKIKDAENVTVTLANALEDVQSILRQERSAAGKHGRTSAKQSGDYILVIGGVESGLYTRVAQTASEIRQEAHREAESMRTLIYQTASELRIQAQADKQGLQTLISQTASEIRTEAENHRESLRTLITQTASEIRSEAASDKESLRSLISQTASSWSAKISGVTDANGNVTAASIAVAINNSTGQSEAKIDAQKVYIGNEQSTTVIAGKALATDLAATDAKIENITIIEGSARYVSSNKIYATQSLSVGNGVGAGAGTFYYKGTLYNPNFVVLKDKNATNLVEATVLGTGTAQSSVNLTHCHEITVAEGTGDLAGKMVVTLGAPRATEGTANFNIADTQTYISGVSAADHTGRAAVTLADPTWNAVTGALPANRTVTVATTGRTNASGTTDNLSKSVALYLTGGTSWDSDHKATVKLRTGSASGTEYAALEVDAGSVYSAGETAGEAAGMTAGRAAVGLADPTWNEVTGALPDHRTVTVKTTGRTNASGITDNLEKSVALYLTGGTSWDSSHKATVKLRTGSAAGTEYAALEVDASSVYSAGETAGAASGANTVTLQDPSWTNTPSASISGNSNTVTVRTSGRPTQLEKAITLYMSQGSWSGGSKYVYTTHTDSDEAHRVARSLVSIGSWTYGAASSGSSEPSSYDKMYSISGTAKYVQFKVTVANQSKTIVIKVLSAS